MPTLQIDPDLLDRAERWAAARGRNLNEVVEQYLRRVSIPVEPAEKSRPQETKFDPPKLPPSVQAAVGLLKSDDPRPYREIIADAMWEKHVESVPRHLGDK